MERGKGLHLPCNLIYLHAALSVIKKIEINMEGSVRIFLVLALGSGIFNSDQLENMHQF